MKEQRFYGFAIIAIIYVLAVLVGLFVYQFFSLVTSLYGAIFLADVAATLFVYLAGIFVRNTSVYDPYWSVQPLVILLFVWNRLGEWSIGSILLFVALFYWGIRLTINWAYTFDSLATQDWRYDLIKEKTKRFYPIVSLIGINLMPTVIVFLCVWPALIYLEKGGFNGVSIFGFIVCITAATLQLFADIQMQRYRKSEHNREDIIHVGLWKYSRHPNYLGEIMMWWGIYVMMLSVYPEGWYYGIGALINTLMFFFISIPLAEKRLASYKHNFDAYKESTRVLLPFPKSSR